ncbi:FtsW/RodA/SpoVE family cell cycle protein [Metabacillus halosaccharovorans]|uniref:FtsW/RodA/SpoVE family cell cycle protein n=1 Tax=Metabacillus halosaccharovorans TaxID=930124 RepID=UPI001C1FDA5D|nr:FtsW/RodA/SpoVE family cell cycle protein [Metabacillus halosaccharovorans]MBU7595241.1 rod shape-determining protein RodA [Metabacillus halosaccharovorans]
MNQRETTIDSLLLFILFCMFVISLIAIYSGSGQYETSDPFYFVKRQLIWYIIGIVIMAGVAIFDYELLDRLAIPFYVIGLVLLIIVHFFGTYKNGSQRWISFGFFELQPSEFMKVFLILFLSVLLSKLGTHRLHLLESIPITAKVGIYTVLPFMLILIQPDLGSALVIGAIFISLIVVSGIPFRMITILLSAFVGMVGFLVYLHQQNFSIFIKIIKPHQLERIYGWLNPYDFAGSYGYQLTQALRGIEVQSGRVPEAHTDFIFSVIGEEFGFVGAATLISLYFLLIYRMIKIAHNAQTLFGYYICSGCVGLIAFQVFQNIGMTIGLMPITGLALPFISYGGSALITNMIAIGLVLSVNIRSKKYMFSEY